MCIGQKVNFPTQTKYDDKRIELSHLHLDLHEYCAVKQHYVQ